MTLDSAFVPIPSEITMPFAGFLAGRGELNFLLVVLTGTLASVIGSVIGYYIGFFLEETVLINLIRKYGKILLLTENDYIVSKAWFGKYGDKVVLVSRLIPGLRTFISLPAGMFAMNKKKFLAYTILGSAVWTVVLTYIGFTAGKNWEILGPIFKKLEIGIAVLVVLGIIFYINHKLKIIKLPGLH